MKNHSNLWNEVYKGEKPETDWTKVIIFGVITITLCWLLFTRVVLVYDVMPMI